MQQKKLSCCLLIIVGLFFYGYVQSQITLRVSNTHSYPLYNYPVRISLLEIKDSLAVKKDYQIKDKNTGKNLLLQRIHSQSAEKMEFILFQDDFKKHEVKFYTLTAVDKSISTQPSKVFCRFVPERMDDFAWENDRIAFRMYGPSLEQELVSSGIDVWLKKTSQLVINTWYDRGDYHEDHGQGLDLYSVGPSLGCGGLAIWHNKNLYSSRNFTSWKIYENGPLRLRFELTYEPWEVNGLLISETKQISLIAGHHFNKIKSHFHIQGEEGKVTVAVGLKIHEELNPHLQSDHNQGWISVWEETPENGAYGCAVLMDPGNIKKIIEAEAHILILTDISDNDTLTYYTGAGWDQSESFDSEQDWIDYIGQMAKQIQGSVGIEFE